MVRRRHLALAACLSILALARTGAAAPLSVEEVVARHHDAMGRLPGLVAHWSGTVVTGAQSTHYEITAARDGRFRQVFKLPLAERSQGSNGILDWQQDENGNVQAYPAEHHVSMDARLVRLNDVRLDPRHAALSGFAEINGRKAYVVNAMVEGTLSVIYIDAATFLVAGGDFGDKTVRYSVYRRFQGVPVPSRILEEDGATNATISVDSCSFPTVQEDYDPPPQRRPRFPSGVDQIALGFDSPKGLIVVRATIDDHPVRLLIDSGSTTSLIDADLAKRLNLETGGVARVQGAGLLTGSIARVDHLDIAGIRFAPFFMEAVPLRLPPPIARDGIDGVLGYDLFAPLVIRISYRHEQIQLFDPGSFKYAGTGQVLAIETASRVPITTASVGQNDRGTFTVDTGSDARLVLYRSFADANRRDFIDPWDYSQDLGSGAGGDFPTRIATVSRLNLGSYSLPNLVTEVIMREAGAFGSSSSDGIVGSGSLALFDAVFFDYPNKRLILER